MTVDLVQRAEPMPDQSTAIAVEPAQLSLEIRSGGTRLQIRVDGKAADVQAIASGIAKLCGTNCGDLAICQATLPARPWKQTLSLCGSQPTEDVRRAVADYDHATGAMKCIADQVRGTRTHLVFEDVEQFREYAQAKVQLLERQERSLERVAAWLNGLDDGTPEDMASRAECKAAIANARETIRNGMAAATRQLERFGY